MRKACAKAIAMAMANVRVDWAQPNAIAPAAIGDDNVNWNSARVIVIITAPAPCI